MRRVIDQMKMRELTIVYGLTETSPGLTQTPRDADLVERTQTVGRVMPEIEVRIVDPATGADVPRRRRRRAVGARLHGDEGLLQDARRHRGGDHEGRLAAQRRSGIDRSRGPRADHRPHQGHHHPRRREHRAEGSRGRAARRIRRSPTRPSMPSRASSSAKRSRRRLRLHPGAAIVPDEVQAFCRERIAKFKVPRFISVVDAFPLTASGKIQKFRLREMHEAELRVSTGSRIRACANTLRLSVIALALLTLSSGG